MKSAIIHNMWESYARKMLAAGVPLRSIAATMNLRNKHRAKFTATADALYGPGDVLILRVNPNEVKS